MVGHNQNETFCIVLLYYIQCVCATKKIKKILDTRFQLIIGDKKWPLFVIQEDNVYIINIDKNV
jgi:hypothetical protein